MKKATGMKWLFCIVLVYGCVHSCAQEAVFTGCSSGTSRVISYDNTLVPQAGVLASSEDTLFNPDDNLFHRNNIPLRLWCTEAFEDSQSSEGEGMNLSDMLLYNESRSFDISVNFSRPLLLTHIITSGFSNGYVNNFTVESSMDHVSLSPYSYSDTVQEFIAQQIDTVFTLARPLAALRLHLDIHDGIMTPSGRLCWHLTLLGCTLQEGVTEDNVEVSTSHDPPIPPTQMPHPDTEAPPLDCTTVPSQAPPTNSTEEAEREGGAATPTSQTPPRPTNFTEVGTGAPSTDVSTATPTPHQAAPPATEVETRCGALLTSAVPTTATPTTPPPPASLDTQLLLMVVPAAVSAVTVLLCSCVVIALCIHLRCSPHRRKKSSKVGLAIGSTDTLGMVDNELYKSRSSIFPISVNHTSPMATDKNTARARVVITAPLSNLSVYENCASANNMFRSYKESGFYESITPRSPDMLEKSVDSMVENPIYSVPFPVSYEPLNNVSELLLDPGDEEPPLLTPALGASSIDMVDNECYSSPSS